ncbi:hypothetical protein ABB37_08438 [Leptomonas pyrrhocoris]|uniref:CHCH domain-containing protein n=1 Tax=Leptomonas pyrrhocoris TaxID=157538 RepID=A0A0M9FTD1_LEPPY|nr:hypothetical protein ABB37_08438 [Leptomonas pyrrhocoris]XP_015653989.1 hypothetical protein ABB37_08438 [Leptomonas pyrrhocoris]KPA75549.1 hypothetical protein ABB37_08438 [Leptomonas pyrrhocoris]KPA75550.1 hypothetical protein ABB37_08438 [Leptomonas pyrrhocoris]|eukprot:XP_015653988.1 hypothetical protein ABB37_08438 [Leptomonas pyrrhocoris]
MAEDNPLSLAQQQQQQRPAQTPTGSQGFFMALLSPLYSSPRNLPSRDSSANLDAQATSTSTTTTPSASPTTASPHPQRGALTATNNSAPLSLITAKEQPPYESRVSSAAWSPQNGGRVQPRLPFPPPAMTPAEGGRLPGPVSVVGGEAYVTSHHNAVAATAVPKGGASGLPALSASPSAQGSVLQHGSGACAPHMLGYRQCLEVNPDFKTNCTWALDNYMRCKEDTEL